MRIVLINPASPFLIRQDVMPPLGLWYLSKVLKERGHEVEIVDVGLGDRIPEKADVFGLTGTSAQVREIERVAYHLRGRKGFKVAGGPHATLAPHEMLELGFDAVIQHEGEEVIGEVVEKEIRGVVTATRMKDIDHLFPDRSQQRRYHYEINGLPAVTMMTSRGCPYNCAFCSKDVWGRQYTRRGVWSVVKEVDEVMRLGYEAIMFYDDTFVIGRDRLYGICSQLRARNITWRAFARSDQVDLEMLNTMRISGCVEIGVGVETGSEQIAENIHKGETVEEQGRCIELAHRVGLRVKAFIIVGLPGETWQTVEETSQFLEKYQPDDVDISILSVYPGSAIYKYPERYDIKFRRGDYRAYKGKPGEYISTVSTSRMSKREIVEAREMLHRRHKK